MKINNNIQESYCSFEVSKLLKEKGFDGPSQWGYFEDSLTQFHEGDDVGSFRNSDECKDWIAAPTHALAIEWIRVNFGIFINNTIDALGHYRANIFTYNDHEIFNSPTYSKPQEATEAALKYCLTELIK